MRTRLVIGLAALMLLVPAAAFAVDADVDLETLCYVDPTNELCIDVGDIDDEEDTTDVGGVTDDEEVDAEVLGVTAERSVGGLAVTGTDTLVIALLAAALLGGGAILLVSTRRRSRRSVQG